MQPTVNLFNYPLAFVTKNGTIMIKITSTTIKGIYIPLFGAYRKYVYSSYGNSSDTEFDYYHLLSVQLQHTHPELFI